MVSWADSSLPVTVNGHQTQPLVMGLRSNRESSKLTNRNQILNVFINGLFKKTISSSDHLASNSRMISEYKTGGKEESRHGLL
jgi:hypothetical protein